MWCLYSVYRHALLLLLPESQGLKTRQTLCLSHPGRQFSGVLSLCISLSREARAGPTQRIESVATPTAVHVNTTIRLIGSDTPERRSINVRIQKFAATRGHPS